VTSAKVLPAGQLELRFGLCNMHDPAAPGSPQRTRWGVIAMLFCFSFLGHFNREGLSVVGTEQLIKSNVLTEVQMGAVYTAFLIVYTAFMLPGGWLIDRFGPAAALRWMGYGFGVCAILTGVVGWMGWAATMLWASLVMIRGLAGAASAPLHPGAARGVSLWAAPEARATANGLVTAGALVGIAVAPPCIGQLIDLFGWPAACAIGGALLVAFAFIWKIVAPQHETRLQQRGAIDVGASDAAAHAAPAAPGPGAWHLLGNRSLVLLTLSYTALGYLQYVFFYWVQHYIESVLGRTKSESRWATFTITMSMAVGMAAGGRLSDAACLRYGDRWGRRIIAFTGMGLCALFAYLGVRSTDLTSVTLLFSLSLGALGMCEGIFWTTATEIGRERGGLAASILNTGGNAVGAFAPTITPWLAEEYGWEAAIGVACVICAIGGSLWLGIDAAADGRRNSDAPL